MSDKVSELTAASSINETDKLYLVQSGASKSISANVLFSNIKNPTLKGNLKLDSDVQILSSAGIVDITKQITKLNIGNTNEIINIPFGGDSQMKVIVAVSVGSGNFQLTGNVANDSNILFANVGDTAMLLSLSNIWYVVGGTASIQ